MNKNIIIWMIVLVSMINIASATNINSFLDGTTESNLSIGSNGFINPVTKYLSIPIGSKINSAYILMNGSTGNRSIYDELDYFEDEYYQDKWTNSTGTFVTIIEENNSLNFVTDTGEQPGSFAYTNNYITSVEDFKRDNSLLLDMDYSIRVHRENTNAEGKFTFSITDGSSEVEIYSEDLVPGGTGFFTSSDTLFYKLIFYNDEQKVNVSYANGTYINEFDLSSLSEYKLKFNSRYFLQSGASTRSVKVDIVLNKIGQNLNESEYTDWNTSESYTQELPNEASFTVGDTVSYFSGASFTGNNISFGTDLQNEIDFSVCDCTGCTLNETSCKMPVKFSTNNGANLSYSNLNIDYTQFGILNNCSVGETVYTFNFKDHITNEFINVDTTGSITYLNNTQVYYISELDKSTFDVCVFPSGATFEGEILLSAGSDDYSTRNFIDSNAIFNQTLPVTENILLVNSTDANVVTFNIRDRTQNPVESALMDFYRESDGLLLQQALTDGVGNARAELDPDTRYILNITSALYPTKTITLVPFETSYSIILEQNETDFYENVYDGVSFTIRPSVRTNNVTNKFFNITLDMFSSDIQYFGIELTNHNFTCIPANCLSNITANSGQALVQINASSEGTFEAHFFYKRPNYDLQYINARWFLFTPLIEDSSFENFLEAAERFREKLLEVGGEPFVALASCLFISTVAVTGAQLGIIGLGIIIMVGFGNMFMMSLGFLDPVVGLINILWGFAIYFVLEQN